MQKEVAAAIVLAQAEVESVKATTTKLTLLERIAKGLSGFGFGAEGKGFITEEEEASLKAAEDELLRLQDLALQLQIDFKKITETKADSGDGIVRGPQTNLTNGLTPEDLIILDSKKILTEELSLLQTGTANEIKANALAETILAEQVKDAKIGIAQNTLSLIGSIAKEGSALGKGVAVAQATISGFQGVQNAFTSASASPVTSVFPAYPFIQAGLAGAFSAVQIGKILSTKPVETGAPSLGGSGGGGGRPSAPSFNLVQGSASNQIANSVQNGTQPVRAFVTSSDISSNLELDRRIESGSTL